jgi:hypothetical protein
MSRARPGRRPFGRDPLLVPLAGKRGEAASLTTPDSLNGSPALNQDGVAPPEPVIRAGKRSARRGRPHCRRPLRALPRGHERAVEVQRDFLRRHLGLPDG